MELFQIILLALVQGVTEFLPISSSAHLILVPKFMELTDQGLLFDVALHGGTLLAILLYLKDDVQALTIGVLRRDRYQLKLLMLMALATVPVGLVGLIFHDFISGSLRSSTVIAVSSIIWGGVLYLADRSAGSKRVEDIGWKIALLIGLAQALALIPGTSRSGITMTAALFLSFSRVEAARFSFLLSIPVIVLAMGLETLKFFKAPAVAPPGLDIIIGFLIAFASAYLTVKLLMNLLSRLNFTPFVIYRVLLGVAILSLL